MIFLLTDRHNITEGVRKEASANNSAGESMGSPMIREEEQNQLVRPASSSLCQISHPKSEALEAYGIQALLLLYCFLKLDQKTIPGEMIAQAKSRQPLLVPSIHILFS